MTYGPNLHAVYAVHTAAAEIYIVHETLPLYKNNE